MQRCYTLRDISNIISVFNHQMMMIDRRGFASDVPQVDCEMRKRTILITSFSGNGL